MSRTPFYEAVYHREDYTLADAFRPQPGCGRRRFRCDVATLGDHTESQLLAVAHETAPNGHRLTSLSLYPSDGDEKVIWSTSPDPRLNHKPKEASNAD